MPENRAEKPLVLVTGFAPQGVKAEDHTAALLQLLVDSPPERALIRTQVLPADPEGALLKAIEAMDRLMPDAVIGLGLNEESSGLSVERVALNLDDREPSRPGGRTEPIDAAGPAAYFSTLPVHMMAERIRSGGVPAGVSNSAGTLSAIVCSM